MAPGAPACDWTSDPGDKIALVAYFASIKDKIGQGGSCGGQGHWKKQGGEGQSLSRSIGGSTGLMLDYPKRVLYPDSQYFFSHHFQPGVTLSESTVDAHPREVDFAGCAVREIRADDDMLATDVLRNHILPHIVDLLELDVALRRESARAPRNQEAFRIAHGPHQRNHGVRAFLFPDPHNLVLPPGDLLDDHLRRQVVVFCAHRRCFAL
ncbi:hypothetical protein B0H10DRAFT_215482 [Mycena sp. CBHHK59/15]|nr:hypothetical protein B0H10DRAFT_215482 [Mycena sp. CBHHK59/15]